MSTRRDRWTRSTADGSISGRAFRGLALAGTASLIASFLYVLYDVTTTVGGGNSLLWLVAILVVAATILASTIGPRTAAAVAVVAAIVGFAYYLDAAGVGVGAAVTMVDQLASDMIALGTGLTLEAMVAAGVWTLGFAPAPVFLSWYLALRRRYILSVLPGGSALLFLVLTGDASLGVTLVGMIGGITAVGFGELERRDGSIAQADLLAIVFAVVLVLSMTVTLVPGGAADPAIVLEGDQDGTLEGTIDSAPERSGIGGSVDLDPEVRFSVTAEEETYWRTGVYDRYTGDSWVRTGQEAPYDDEELPVPPGRHTTAAQTVVIEDDMDVMPASAQPVAVDGEITENTEITRHGDVLPDDPLIEEDTYNVESVIVNPDSGVLQEAGDDYPEEIEETYLQQPEDTSSEFEEYTAEVVDEADAETPYETAVAIEAYLRESKEYSLDVERPSGDVAEAFLLDMDEGYCVYFATSMVQMLRAEEVPARYATGYTSGQQVGDDEYVVRGLDAHAWVEVYVPDQGWVEFEPTPPARDSVHDDELEEAREEGETGVDTEASEDVPVDGTDGIDDPDVGDDDPEDGEDPEAENGENESVGDGDRNDSDGPGPLDDIDGAQAGDGGAMPGDIDGTDDEEDEEPTLTAETVALAFAVAVGLVAGAHRTGVTALASREARMYWHGRRGDPSDDAERAYRRVELLLERRYRPREEGESVRQYLDALSVYGVDQRVERLGTLYERARYADGVSSEEADEAVSLADELTRSRLPLAG